MSHREISQVSTNRTHLTTKLIDHPSLDHIQHGDAFRQRLFQSIELICRHSLKRQTSIQVMGVSSNNGAPLRVNAWLTALPAMV